MNALTSDNWWYNTGELIDMESPTAYPHGFPYCARHKNLKISSELKVDFDGARNE